MVHPQGMQVGTVTCHAFCLLSSRSGNALEVNSPPGRGVSNHYATKTTLGTARRGWRVIGTTLSWQPLAPGFAPAAPNSSEQRMKMQKTGFFLRNVWDTGSKEWLLLTEVQFFLGASLKSHNLSFSLNLLRWFCG